MAVTYILLGPDSCLLKGMEVQLINDRGHLFFTVISLSPPKYMQDQSDLPFFPNKEKLEQIGEEDQLIIPAARDS